eukprot:TRINITY_DN3314_c4_g1_i12.p1 TRINITY_DN3314_c4_g1~~TRINITY_DN3314_c4_g1_i12.p1  ORF type:complete len:424 (+),score=115.87 TRINITY_DN3314_c4_g1_i12:873-2144(+)
MKLRIQSSSGIYRLTLDDNMSIMDLLKMIAEKEKVFWTAIKLSDKNISHHSRKGILDSPISRYFKHNERIVVENLTVESHENQMNNKLTTWNLQDIPSTSPLLKPREEEPEIPEIDDSWSKQQLHNRHWCPHKRMYGICAICLQDEERKIPRIKGQKKLSCVGCSVDTEAMNMFSSLAIHSGFSLLTGYLIGYYGPNGAAICESIFLPQTNDVDNELTLISRLMRPFDYKVIGIVIVEKAGIDEVISFDNLMKSIELAKKFGNNFVTLIVKPTEDNNVSINPYIISDQALQLMDVIEFSEDEEEPENVISNMEVYVELKLTNKIHKGFLILPIRINSHVGKFYSEFPGYKSFEVTDIHRKLANEDDIGLTFVEKLKDLNFLMFIADSFDPETACTAALDAFDGEIIRCSALQGLISDFYPNYS